MQRYFLRPDGTFEIEGTTQAFSDLLYSDYYQLFRLESYSLAKAAKNPHWFVERPSPPSIPSMHVIRRDANTVHITRLQSVPLSFGEVFYLRALLQTRPARSFDELRTVNGVVYSTFQEVCISLNIFPDKTEAEYCFIEAIEGLRTPMQIRYLYIHMLTNDCIPFPADIWQRFRNALSEDFYFSNGQNWDLAYSTALLEIAGNLREYGKDPQGYCLPHPENIGDEVVAEIQRWSSQIPSLLSMAEHALALFNTEQSLIFQTIWSAILFKQPLCAFVDGKAGRGKTFLVNALCSQVRGHGGIVLATASSAFAAQLYPGGRTTHSMFKASYFLFMLI